jgi:hypothetical protein
MTRSAPVDAARCRGGHRHPIRDFTRGDGGLAMAKAKENDDKYVAFISHSSKDAGWAKRLCADLAKKGIATFLDKERLEAGRPWDSQLRQELSASRHLIVLWSDNAKKSEWVQHEQTFFFSKRLAEDERKSVRHRFITIELQGENEMFRRYQAITDLKGATYEAGVDRVDPALWRRMIAALERLLKDDDKSIPVPVIVLTTTKPRIRELNPEGMPSFAPALEEMLAQFGVGARDRLEAYYGDRREHWRPFGSVAEDVWGLLHRVQDDINASNESRGGLRFRWEPLGEEFWGDDVQAIDREARKLESGPALIVIDPLALYDRDVTGRLDRLSKCFHNDSSLIMVLPPFNLPSPCTALRGLVQHLANQIYEYSYEPPWYTGLPFAKCSAQTIDFVEVKRLLQTSLVPRIGRARSRPLNAYLSVGK